MDWLQPFFCNEIELVIKAKPKMTPNAWGSRPRGQNPLPLWVIDVRIINSRRT